MYCKGPWKSLVHDLFMIYSLTSHYNFFCSQAADTFVFLIALIIPNFKQAKKNKLFCAFWSSATRGWDTGEKVILEIK